MSPTTTRWGRCAGILALALAAVVGPLATGGVAASSVVSGTPVLAPGLVSTNRVAFYSTTWTNESPSTLSNPDVLVNLPAGSTLVSADPPTCTTSSGSDAVLVTCQEPNLAGGATLTQQLLIQFSTSGVVSAVMIADEAGNDQNKSHLDAFPTDPPSQTITIATGDAAGGCLRDGEAPLATQPGLSANNPLITTASLAGSSGQICVPVTVQEKPATSSTEACGAGATCTTDIATTDFIPISAQSSTSPIALSFTIVGNNRNITWYKNGISVADCAGATSLASGVSACITARSKPTAKSVRLDLLWRAGVDPTWRG
jgi:Domain of unknown function DUF11